MFVGTPINMMAYQHGEREKIVDHAKRRKKSKLDRYGYLGWTRSDLFREQSFVAGDNYPRANTDLQDVSQLPVRGRFSLFGVSSVTGELNGLIAETFSVGGTQNVLNTGREQIEQFDEVYAVLLRPSRVRPDDYQGKLGADTLEFDHLTAFTFPYSPAFVETYSGFDELETAVHPTAVFHVGRCLTSGRPGEKFGVSFFFNFLTYLIDDLGKTKGAESVAGREPELRRDTRAPLNTVYMPGWGFPLKIDAQ